jgi:hypothetical protein
MVLPLTLTDDSPGPVIVAPAESVPTRDAPAILILQTIRY